MNDSTAGAPGWRLHRNAFGRLVLVDEQGLEHVGVVPVRAFPIGAPDEGLSLLGSTLLAFPEPFLALAQAGPQVEAKARGYLMALAFALPASLLFTVYRGFNIAVSRPKAVMALQLAGLGLKVPLSWALHQEIHAFGIWTFENKHGVNLARVAARLAAEVG